jgi:lycopene cyclase domain-containing protein
MKSLYLLVNFFTIFIPFIYSFHPRIRFDRSWKAFFLAAVCVGALFVIWDAIFTDMGVWGFNPRYLLGIFIAGLPLEEILFFICIPFSCVFTFYCLTKFYDLRWNDRTERIFCLVFSLLLLVAAGLFYDRLYTFITFLSTAMVCLLLKFVAKVDWFGSAFTVYMVLLIPFFIVNGVLTGTGIEEQVVWYNDAENLGIRVLTIPIEDAFYGFELILLDIYLYKRFVNYFSRET